MAPGLPDGTELERLKKAVDVKIAPPQQRANLAIRSSPNRTPSMGSNRICPIQEGRTLAHSRDDREQRFDGVNGVRQGHPRERCLPRQEGGRQSPCEPPANPSYPFPYIPGTTKPFTPGLHQSFTTLSATLAESIGLTSRESTVSESSTPQPGRHIDKILEDLDQRDIKAG
ncbi:hypothetical protein POJ06DRAFT_268005 [Lipomyces tetrasporus]|uniref:Uncharacterized protein n=1 Tax=Lipomyces tetrasporus TaxID=54092 RepID=A0AAD7QS15_9ASCO|nr:uncharacterized protein POJ06DRAFT_268005 [Lipomyces tetrasporus]KAJ8100408.1 hypothetical protein POJ06DRAFT_268005 [Lipomyces tetrasporus]